MTSLLVLPQLDHLYYEMDGTCDRTQGKVEPKLMFSIVEPLLSRLLRYGHLYFPSS